MKQKILILFLPLLFAACDSISNSGDQADVSGDWLIPKDEVFDGGPGRDGIPAIESPKFDPAGSVGFIANNDLVVGIKIGNEVKAYPHPILNWHEIVNDEISGTAFALTYCPLTGSAIAWNRKINGSITTFGVSGFLYFTNLIPFDRATNSNWVQMKLQSVNGPLIGTFAETFQIIETTFETWKKLYPDSKVLNTNTGFNRPYNQFPYGDYRTNNNQFLFPVPKDDNRLPFKERVHGVIINGKSKVYRLNSFGAGLKIINDTFNGTELVIAGSTDRNFSVIFNRKLNDATVLSFSAVDNELPVIMVDNEGTKYDVFGKAVKGPRVGEQLKSTLSYVAYWFAWAAFNPGAEIYQ